MFCIYIKLPAHRIYKIVTNSAGVVSKIKLKYCPYVFDFKTFATEDCYIIRIIEQNNMFCFDYSNNKTINSNLLISTLSSIIHETQEISSDFLAIHGAAVERNGKAMVFIAPTKAGKTTLTCYLGKKGYNYITDDCVLINKNTLDVIPFLVPLSLRSGGIKVLKEQNLDLLNEVVELDERYIYMPTNKCIQTLSLDTILFITRTDENKISDILYKDKLMKLLHSPMINTSIDAEYLGVMLKLAQKRCLNLYYKDLNYVLNIINTLPIK